ncbi:MAG: HEAT repeat domain-containing protein, partial [Cyanobacteria bacterium]|nr:HEAT repeat domain-containing protein [Cyanobacteriota bacterium]
MSKDLIPRTAEKVTFADGIALYSNDTTVEWVKNGRGDLLPGKIVYSNKSAGEFAFDDSGKLTKFVVKDARKRLMLEVSAEKGTYKIVVEPTSKSGKQLTLETAQAPLLSDDGVLSFQSQKQPGKPNPEWEQLTLDASGRVIIRQLNAPSIVISPGKFADYYTNENWMGVRLFTDGRQVLFYQDEKNKGNISEIEDLRQDATISYKRHHNAGQEFWIREGTWHGSRLKPCEGALILSDNLAPQFVPFDGANEIDQDQPGDTPPLKRLLANQMKLIQFLPDMLDLRVNKEVASRLESAAQQRYKKSWLELGQLEHSELNKDEKLKIDIQRAKDEIQSEFKRIGDSLHRERELLSRALATSDLEDGSTDLRKVWKQLPETRKYFEDVASCLEKDLVPDALRTLARRDMPFPINCPIPAIKDRNGEFIPSAVMVGGDLNKHAPDGIKLGIKLDQFPLHAPEKLLETIQFCLQVKGAEYEAALEYDLKTVLPWMIKKNQLPQSWLSSSTLSNESHRAALGFMIDLSTDIKEYANSMTLSPEVCKAANIPLPPFVKRVFANGLESLEFSWPESACPNDPATSRFIEESKRWIETHGKRFDQEMETLLTAQADLTRTAFYGDIPMKGFAVLDKDGRLINTVVRREDLQSLPDNCRVEEFNLLSGGFKVEKRDDRYLVSLTWQTKRSGSLNYLDILADDIGLPLERSLPPMKAGDLVPLFDNRGKVRMVPVENLQGRKNWQLFSYWGDKVSTGVIDSAMVIGAVGTGGVAYFAGRAGVRTLADSLFRGSMGLSGFALNNSKVMTSDWGQTAHKIRGHLIMVDVFRNFYRTFRGPESTSYLEGGLKNLNERSGALAFVVRGANNIEHNHRYQAMMRVNDLVFLSHLVPDLGRKLIGEQKQPELFTSQNKRRVQDFSNIKETEQTKKLLAECAQSGNAEGQIDAAETLVKLGAKSPFFLAAILRGLISDKTTSENGKVAAVKSLTRMINELDTFERRILPTLEGEDRNDYFAQSSGFTCPDLLEFLRTTSSDPSQSRAVRIAAAFARTLPGNMPLGTLNEKLDLLTDLNPSKKESSKNQNEFIDRNEGSSAPPAASEGSIKLADRLSKRLVDGLKSADLSERLLSNIVLRDLKDDSPVTRTELNSSLVELISAYRKGLKVNPDSSEVYGATVVVAVSLLGMSENGELDDSARHEFIELLKIPDKQIPGQIKVAVLRQIASLSKGGREKELCDVVQSLFSPDLKGRLRAADPELRCAAVHAITEGALPKDNLLIVSLQQLAAPPSGERQLEPDARVRLAALETLSLVDSTKFMESIEQTLKGETNMVVRAYAENAKLKEFFPVRDDLRKLEAQLGGKLLGEKFNNLWEQGGRHLDVIHNELKKIPVEIQKEVTETRYEPRYQLHGPPATIAVRTTKEVACHNPARLQFLDEHVFEMAIRPGVDREKAEQIVFFLASDLENKEAHALLNRKGKYVEEETAYIRNKTQECILALSS